MDGVKTEPVNLGSMDFAYPFRAMSSALWIYLAGKSTWDKVTVDPLHVHLVDEVLVIEYSSFSFHVQRKSVMDDFCYYAVSCYVTESEALLGAGSIWLHGLTGGRTRLTAVLVPPFTEQLQDFQRRVLVNLIQPFETWLSSYLDGSSQPSPSSGKPPKGASREEWFAYKQRMGRRFTHKDLAAELGLDADYVRQIYATWSAGIEAQDSEAVKDLT